MLDAALAYAEAGWYVLPVKQGTKHPGSVVGDGWPSMSSKDPKQLAAWFIATDYGIALHCGRSGAVVLDVDEPANVPDEVLLVMESDGPHQSTRKDQPSRGHYLLANETGRRIGNGLGELATTPKWGEVRGANGVIIAAPSVHPDGGCYQWERTGKVPPIPDYLAQALPKSSTPEDTATDNQVEAFLDAHTQSDRPQALTGLVNTLTTKLAGGHSCHMSTLGILTDAMAEAAAGQYPARQARDALRPIYFQTATTGTSTGRVLTQAEAKSSFDGIVAWAVGQAPGKAEQARDRVADKYRDNVIEITAEEFDTKGQIDQPVFTFTTGGVFIFDQPDIIPAIWGSGTFVLWAEGESLMIAGPMGLGKTTLGGQLVRARLGLGDGYVLGLPVADSGGVVLYLAMDRPRQIARSLGRQFRGEYEREIADARLVVWQGPPPGDIAQYPGLLLKLAQAAGADTVVIDSVKDAAVGLTNDEVGAGYNRARQLLIAAGIDLLELHHTVKRGANGGAPTAAADVYGSAWIANGTGSIILLSGDPGDPIVGFKHIRQPADEVGPWQVHHDQTAGRLTISESFDVVAFVADCGRDGATAIALAEALNPGLEWLDDRERNSAREKARRQLERLVTAGKLQRLNGVKGGGSDRTPTAYSLAEVNHEAITLFTKPQVELSRTESITKAITQPSRQSRETPKPQVKQSRTQSRTTPAKPITQPTLPVGEGGARGDRRKARITHTGDPACVHCRKPAVGNQRDADGNPAHFACQSTVAESTSA